ncbi:MAG: hypothetical protein ACXAEN_19740 [Candidatus Thorarchaeota archaeon]|jgi:hypothetical protein
MRPHRRRNSASDTVRIKFTFNAIQRYFELANEFNSVKWSRSLLIATFAQHIDLYRVLDQREMFIISTEGDFSGGDFNTELERVTGAAFAATSLQDVVKWGLGWRKRGRLVGDLYALKIDGFNKTFSHLSRPEDLGIDMSDLREALLEYQEKRISFEEAVERSGLLDREFDVPKDAICTTGLGCSLLLREHDKITVYKVIDDKPVEIPEIPQDIEYPILKTVYALADPDANTLDDLMYEGVWGRGVYVTDDLDVATTDAEHLGLAVFEVGLTLTDAYVDVFELSQRNTHVSEYGSSLKDDIPGNLNAFLVRIGESHDKNTKSYFVSREPLDNDFLDDDICAQEDLVDDTLEYHDIECGGGGHVSIEGWLSEIDAEGYGECEEYDMLVDELGEAEADKELIKTYYFLLRRYVGLPESVTKAERLSNSSELGAILLKRGYPAVRSQLDSPLDNYLCILNPKDFRSRITTEM